MALVGIIPQSQATVVNMGLSLQKWLNTIVAAPYLAAASTFGYGTGACYDPVSGKWTQDGKGVSIMVGLPDDPALFERAPAIGYCLDDGRTAKPPVPTGMGDGSVWEWTPCTVCITPPLRFSSDGSSPEQDKLGMDYLKSYIKNALPRSYIIPLYDRAQPDGLGFYEQVSVMYIENFRSIRLTPNFRESLLINRDRAEYDFYLKLCVATTGGL